MGRSRRWRADERGGTTVQYGMFAVVIALVMVAGVKAFEVTMEFREKRVAAALERSGGATAAIRNAEGDIVTGSIRRKGE